jgi:ABC-2 type transport system permease protein
MAKERIRRQLRPILTFARIDVKRLFRDKVAIFFVFVFPLIFLFVFGGLFGGSNDVSFNIGMVNRSDSEFAAEFVKQAQDNEILDIDEEVTNLDRAREKMNQSQIDAVIVLPAEFGVIQPGQDYPSGQARILYDQNNQQAGQTLGSILEGQFKEINSQFVDQEAPFSVVAESTDTRGLTQFDYTFSGLLGFSILTLGIFGPTSVFPRLKQRGVLRRYHTTTLKVWQYFTGNVLSNSLVGLMSVAMMFAVALTVFNLDMQGDYLSVIALVVLGVITLFGIGLAVGGWAKNENQAAPLANMITFPMMFLSGVFFPRFLMPEWLQTVSGLLPLTPVVDGARLIITEGKTIFDIGSQVGLLALWAIIIYAIAFKVFRWE